MEHKRYEKIRALWNAENDGILKWTVCIQEKIDGANLSIWRTKEWLFVWSRSQTVWTPEIKEWFNWAVEYVNKHKWIDSLLNQVELDHPWAEIRLFWEWLVPHTISNYNIEAYRHFYLFDIEVNWEPLGTEMVYEYWHKHWVMQPEIFGKYENPTPWDVLQFVWQSHIWPVWEWVVVKNPFFINKFGNKAYAKVVWEKFKEENLITFWGCQKLDSEIKIVLKWCTDGRVRKIINKIEQNEDKDIQIEDVSKIIWMTQHDIITEEVWNYSKFWVIDFKRLKGLLWKRTAKIAIWIINNEPTSVAFEENNI